MSNNQSCLIMMATYNGEKYVAQQIDSIMRQSFSNWKLLIRDDGSSDQTCEILNKYAKIDSRIKVIFNTTDLHGPYYNFHKLFGEAKMCSPYDYYAFCDQDDIWKDNKLEKLIKYCKKWEANNTPVFVYSDLAVIDGENHVIDESVNDILGIDITNAPENLFFAHGYVWGCAGLFNRSLFERVPELSEDFSHRDIMSHDNYIAKHAVIYGKLAFYPKPLILYRKHGGNVTDSHKFKLSVPEMIKKGIVEFQTVSRTHARVYNQSLFAISIMKKESNTRETLGRLCEIELMLHKGGLSTAIKMKKMHICRKQRARTIALYSIMTMNSYQRYLFKD